VPADGAPPVSLDHRNSEKAGRDAGDDASTIGDVRKEGDARTDKGKGKGKAREEDVDDEQVGYDEEDGGAKQTEEVDGDGDGDGEEDEEEEPHDLVSPRALPSTLMLITPSISAARHARRPTSSV
jgi:hypothetical protein